MFNATLLSLAEGQSYGSVKMFEDPDIFRMGLPLVFENWTVYFQIEGKQIVVTHHWNIRVIHLTRTRYPARTDALPVNRMILRNDVIYQNVRLIHHDHWADLGIPHFFIKRDGIAGQMAFTCDEGTFITHDTNVVSLIFEKSVISEALKGGITKSDFSRDKSVIKIQKAARMPETRSGRITH